MVPLLNMQQNQMMAKVSISILVMALPLLYVSFLAVPPATLFRDTTFWFLMSNSIIVVIAADSGMLFYDSSSSGSDVDGVVDDRPIIGIVNDENDQPPTAPSFVVNSDDDALTIAAGKDQDGVILAAPESGARAARRRRSRSHSHADQVQEKKLRRTATERESEYARLSDEELNRRVEDFITKFNREMRLQIEN